MNMVQRSYAKYHGLTLCTFLWNKQIQFLANPDYISSHIHPAKYELFIPIIIRYLKIYFPNTGMFTHHIIVDHIIRKLQKKYWLHPTSARALKKYLGRDCIMINRKQYECFLSWRKIKKVNNAHAVIWLLDEYIDHRDPYNMPQKKEIELDAIVTQKLIEAEKPSLWPIER